ncbi:MAG: RIP metalloprotease RseP [Chromatiales bacterium]|nr:RIP metalloprotease RseP [Gammaproteobacteria bacterium]MCP5352836.1 RIP metalloprotease RseP [Chromatiales bacterium]
MPESLNYVLSFIVAIGVLVTVHEYGHYWVARKAGVKVLRFSVGFGRPLWSRKAGPDQTEYTIAAIPLGGYVKMLDEREGEVAPEEAHRAFNRQTLGKRAAVVVAGPVANFLFAIFAYWVMLMIGVTGSVPLFGQITPDSVAARAGAQIGDRIYKVGDEEVSTWSDAMLAMVDAGIADDELRLAVIDANGFEQLRVLPIGPDIDVTATEGLLGQLGIERAQPRIDALVDSVEQGSPAEQAGVRAGDLIVQAGDKAIGDWVDLVGFVRQRPNVTFDLVLRRAGEEIVLPITAAERQSDGESIGQIGVRPRIAEDYLNTFQTEVSYGPVDAFGRAVGKTWDNTVLLLRVLGQLVIGEASLRNVSGPLSIAEYAGVSASLGIAYFFSFLAIVSISLGVLNLLPVPVLDGGHLLYYLMELVRGGRPLSERAQLIGQQIGIGLLLMLMTLAFYNDLTRLFGTS